MLDMLNSLRHDPPKSIAGFPVTHFEDLRDEQGRFGPLQGATDAASRNVLVFHLGNDARLVLRPSGTEPKAKAYVEACTPACPHGMTAETWHDQCRQVDERAERLGREFGQLAMARVGL
jgi:phosphoglucomutase/phosphomannomutase